MLLLATVKWPAEFGMPLMREFQTLAKRWRSQVQSRLEGAFLQDRMPEQNDASYLYARTIRCLYCDGLIPLPPNWRLSGDGTGVFTCRSLARRSPAMMHVPK